MAGLNTFSVNIVISDASFIPGNIGPSLKLIFRTYHQVRPKLSCEVGAAGPELKLLFLPYADRHFLTSYVLQPQDRIYLFGKLFSRDRVQFNFFTRFS